MLFQTIDWCQNRPLKFQNENAEGFCKMPKRCFNLLPLSLVVAKGFFPLGETTVGLRGHQSNSNLNELTSGAPTQKISLTNSSIHFSLRLTKIQLVSSLPQRQHSHLAEHLARQQSTNRYEGNNKKKTDWILIELVIASEAIRYFFYTTGREWMDIETDNFFFQACTFLFLVYSAA